MIISSYLCDYRGLLSYAMFTTYLQNLGADVFYKNIVLAIGAFVIFGVIGFSL